MIYCTHRIAIAIKYSSSTDRWEFHCIAKMHESRIICRILKQVKVSVSLVSENAHRALLQKSRLLLTRKRSRTGHVTMKMNEQMSLPALSPNYSSITVCDCTVYARFSEVNTSESELSKLCRGIFMHMHRNYFRCSTRRHSRCPVWRRYRLSATGHSRLRARNVRTLLLGIC